MQTRNQIGLPLRRIRADLMKCPGSKIYRTKLGSRPRNINGCVTTYTKGSALSEAAAAGRLNHTPSIATTVTMNNLRAIPNWLFRFVAIVNSSRVWTPAFRGDSAAVRKVDCRLCARREQ